LKTFSSQFLEPFNPPTDQLAKLLSAWKFFLILNAPLQADLNVCMKSIYSWLERIPKEE